MRTGLALRLLGKDLFDIALVLDLALALDADFGLALTATLFLDVVCTALLRCQW